MKALGIHFDRFDRLCTPVMGLLSPLGIDVEPVQEGLNVALALNGHEDDYKIIGEIYFILVPLTWSAGILFLL